MFPRDEHEKLRELCSHFIDEALSPDEKRAFEDHLLTCAQCREELASLQESVSLLKRIPMAPVPRSFALPETRKAHNPPLLTFFRFASALAAVALVFTFSLDVFSQALLPQFSLSGASKAPVSQESRALRQPESTASDKSGGLGALSAPSINSAAQPTTPAGAPPAEQRIPLNSTTPGSDSDGPKLDRSEPVSENAPPTVANDATAVAKGGFAFRPLEAGLAGLLVLLLAGTIVLGRARAKT